MGAISDGNHNGRRGEEHSPPRYWEGVILLDANLNILAFDTGAASILRSEGEAEGSWVLKVPQKILDVLRDNQTSEQPSHKLRLHLNANTYVCRIHVAPWRIQGLPGCVTVLHLARELNIDDTLEMVSAEYRLTVRELQALRGVLTGLTSKEVAEQMSISPNTVKAFLRLVMVKMGVTSRTGILTKLFDQNGHG
ncbi:MAG: transcriptional regulator, LuxR family [Candidatus Solibacter sp.]|nr:transcriptional regulator, LuxR family [Candidatus Solibacter sp.]